MIKKCRLFADMYDSPLNLSTWFYTLKVNWIWSSRLAWGVMRRFGQIFWTNQFLDKDVFKRIANIISMHKYVSFILKKTTICQLRTFLQGWKTIISRMCSNFFQDFSKNKSIFEHFQLYKRKQFPSCQQL